MPIFDYRCPTCGTTFERLFPPDPDGYPTKQACPRCEQESPRQVPLVADTPWSWGDSYERDVPGLGRCRTRKEYERKRDAAGLVEMDNVRDQVERLAMNEADEAARIAKQDRADDERIARETNKLKGTMPPERAKAEGYANAMSADYLKHTGRL